MSPEAHRPVTVIVDHGQLATLRERAAGRAAGKSFWKTIGLGALLGGVGAGGVGVAAKLGVISLAVLGGPWTICAVLVVGALVVGGLAIRNALKASGEVRNEWDQQEGTVLRGYCSEINYLQQQAAKLLMDPIPTAPEYDEFE